MKDFPALMCNPEVWPKTCNYSRRIRTEDLSPRHNKRMSYAKASDRCYEIHTSGDNGSLVVEMLTLAHMRDIPCRLETDREREDHPAKLHTPQGKTHIGCH
jgi:hypothetical protein